VEKQTQEPREKIVLKAIEIVMNERYDSKFSKRSFGFRPGKGLKDAMEYVDEKLRGSKWVIECEVSLDSISHKKLLEILSREIKCSKTISLIKSLMSAGHVDDLGHLTENLWEGKGSVLSRLLCNIYLNELDNYMEDKIKVDRTSVTK
jgi:retron-type reverse transcriptase